MKKLFIFLGLLFSTATMASDLAPVGGEYVSPCSYWRYSSDAGGYICSTRPFSVTLATQYDLETVINQVQALEIRIEVLESHIKELEAK